MRNWWQRVEPGVEALAFSTLSLFLPLVIMMKYELKLKLQSYIFYISTLHQFGKILGSVAVSKMNP